MARKMSFPPAAAAACILCKLCTHNHRRDRVLSSRTASGGRAFSPCLLFAAPLDDASLFFHPCPRTLPRARLNAFTFERPVRVCARVSHPAVDDPFSSLLTPIYTYMYMRRTHCANVNNNNT